MFLPWFLCGVLLVTAIVLLIKIVVLKKSMNEIGLELEEHLSNESNTLISISSADRHARSLAGKLNQQLRLLRQQRQQYLSGDQELKEAVTNISHDLRTPLTAICGYLDLLENTENSETVRRYIVLIKNRTEVMKQLTEELFRYSIIASHANETEMKLVSVGGILEESIAGFYALLQENNIVPSIYIPEKQVVRKLNQADLSRVFANLLSNAIRYSDGDLEITLTEAGEVIFMNTASGLSEVQVGQLFDRFYTVEAARKSTGLGLAISRLLVERMNGSLTAQLAQGRLQIRIVFQNLPR